MAPKNLLQIFASSVKKRGNAPCFRFKENGKWESLTWNEAYLQVLDLAGGLKKLGVVKGDRVCLFSRSRYEWTLADLAILATGAITVPIYESSLPEQAAYIIENAGAKVVFCEDPLSFKKIESVRQKLPNLKQIILFVPGEKKDGVYSLDELMILGKGEGEALFAKMSAELGTETEASYVYTSGTTGPPKGAVLTHGNFLAEIFALKKNLDFPTRTESLLFLPLAHILARCVQFAQIENGFVQCYAESIDKLMDDIAQVKPHLMASVPRIFEKVHTRVMQGVETSSEGKKKIFNWALKVGNERAGRVLAKKGISPLLALQWKIAYALVFSKLHKKMGGRIEYFISGGAPLSKDIAQFFFAAGFLILEGYGLTETTAAVTLNSRENLKIGTVGKPLVGAEIRIAEDGEILVRGPLVFKGYYKKPEDTAQALTADGWFHTGDIGLIDEDGFVKITDRKKDIIVTAAGKNIAPQNIESLFKTDPLISQVMIHGDNRKYLSALITLNKDEVLSYARDKKISFRDYSDLVKNETIYHLIKGRIEEKNRQLAKYETIKKFAILDNDFSVETGELTPTMKVKRKFTSEKYKSILDQFYQE
ncbi:MAG: long-chain fatty acid--CoA ligase [Deltaproteobacteria bacterium]|nr:long-chain fatty acid--CoA ligase [Deltaproteobacteria bacterium]